MKLMGIRAAADSRVEGIVIDANRSVLHGVRQRTGGAILDRAALDHRIDALTNAAAVLPNMLATAVAIDLGRDSMARPLAGSVVFLTTDEQSGTGYGADTVASWVEQHPAKAAHVALAVVLSAFENAANRDWWRRPTTDGAAYLNQLAARGHRLTDVEKIDTGIQPDTDQTNTAEADGEDTAAE